MKKLMLSATALIVFAGSAASVNAAMPAHKTVKSPLTIKSSMIPPTCPLNTPDGCGIYE